MLIPSPRHTPADLAAWQRWQRIDRRMAEACQGRLERLAGQAAMLMQDFAAAGPCYLATSWGRDSTVIADIAARHSLPVPMVYATSAQVPGRVPNPDSPAVRDRFLSMHPGVDYRELPCGVGGIARAIDTERYISGIRGDESANRAMSMRRHGHATATTCRPIGTWTSVDIWAYMCLRDLPVHPAYAMTCGGTIPRDRVRVHSLGGGDGDGRGRIRWEDTYYLDLTVPLRGVTRARPI